MSLITNLQDLATRIASECKSIRTLTNGNAMDLAALNTVAKSNLVAAINEVLAALNDVDGETNLGLGLNDGTSLVITSSNGTNVTVSAATIALAGLMAATDKSKLDEIAAQATKNQTDAYLLNRANHSGTQTTSTISDFTSAVNSLIDNVIGAAPEALDTLQELAAALGDDPNFATSVNSALSNRLRFDAAQTLSGVQQTQAQDNLQVYSRTQIGDPATNFVTSFEAGLV